MTATAGGPFMPPQVTSISRPFSRSDLATELVEPGLCGRWCLGGRPRRHRVLPAGAPTPTGAALAEAESERHGRAGNDVGSVALATISTSVLRFGLQGLLAPPGIVYQHCAGHSIGALRDAPRSE